MKYSRIKLLACSITILSIVGACKKTGIDPVTGNVITGNGSTTANPNKDVNTWIHEQMKMYYLWTDKIPELKNTDLTLQSGYKTGDAAAKKYYFNSLLHQEGTTDRFSWIQESSEDLLNSLSGINKTFGFSHKAFFLNNSKDVGFFVNYVIKNSPADKAGLKRGDFIMTANGVQITETNYQTILQPEMLTFGLGEVSNGTFAVSNKKVSVTRAEVQDNPVHYSTVIEKGTKKIGYFVYKQFIPGTASAFDGEMRQIFGDFKAKGVNELVLDLRLNGGGYISSAVVLSSLIGKGVNSSKLMYTDEWNAAVTKSYKDKYGANYFSKMFSTENNNIGNNLSKVYVLVTKSSASASELVINSLRPYMEVVLIGDNTYGKNVGSITISDDKKRWNWGMQPIVLKTLNAKGESDYGTTTGFTPDYKVTDNVIPFKPWGDETETLLKKAIELITGKPLQQNARTNTIQLDNIGLNDDFGDNLKLNRKEMFQEMKLK